MSEARHPAASPAAIGRWQGRRAAMLAATALALAAAVLFILYFRGRQRIEAVASEARAAVSSGPIDEARALVEKWRAISPGDGEPDYALAWLEIRANRPAEAMDAIRAAAERGYPMGPMEVLRAILLAQAGRYDESMPILLEAYEKDSGPLAEVADALVRFYMRTVRLTEAAAVIARWMEIAPDDARPYIWRVDLYKRGGREDELIIRGCREALRRDPTHDESRLELAERLRGSSMLDEAREEYTKLLASQPKNATVHVGLGRIALLKGDIQAANRHFEEALAADPKSPKALKELALVDVKFGRLKLARERLEQAVRLEPDDLELRYSYTRVLAASGDSKAAAEQTRLAEQLRADQKHIEDLRKRMAEQPDNLEIRADVARWLIEHGHEEEGLDWTRRILAVKSDHPATCRILVDYYTKKKSPGQANYYRLLLGQPDGAKAK